LARDPASEKLVEDLLQLDDRDGSPTHPLRRPHPRQHLTTHRYTEKRAGSPPRACLEGILYLLYTGVRYVDLPRELGFPSGETCRRRLHEWIDNGVWAQALATLVAELDRAGRLDWSRVVIDASLIDAKKGAI
jgi:transposase